MKLKDVCIKGTSNIRQKDVNDSGRYPVYGAAGPVGFMNSFQYDEPYVGVVKDGAGIGRATYLPSNSSIIGTMQALIPKKNVLPKYLYYAVSSMHLEKYYSGATIPHIYFKNYKHERFVLVSKKEQEQIIWRFSLLEKMISNKQQQLLKLDELIKARFVEMFGDPVINSKNLELSTLANLGMLGRGRSKHRPRNDPKLLGGKYPLIQTGEVSQSGLYIRNFSNTYSELGLKQSKLWPKDTLCITIAANIASTSILTFNACFPDSVVGFISNEDKVKPVFLHYWFSFFQNIIESQATQVAQKNINLKVLSNLSVIHPPISLQNEFADFVRQVDKSKFENIVYLNKTLSNKILSQIGDVIRD
ncbi:restriction endonuclease subunit S [Limosilactobacillus reuteri]|mgnify:FL=1|uniref:restriction endonuclease subunit S n=1 Tax=Limosilactobacillus reuteri TaxID=1598 RepID=UPI0021003580|nr:restriction endonuclease subunit S [Limosilactobacillus reuteri]